MMTKCDGCGGQPAAQAHACPWDVVTWDKRDADCWCCFDCESECAKAAESARVDGGGQGAYKP